MRCKEKLKVLKGNCPVIITVPHACDLSERCDTYVEDVVMLLKEQMAKKRCRPYIIISNTERDCIDMNRHESRGTRFRNEIDNMVKELTKTYGKKPTLIDFHTYPKEVPRYGTKDIVIFDMPYKDDDLLVGRTMESTKKTSLNVVSKRAKLTNDIIFQHRDDTHALLIEVNDIIGEIPKSDMESKIDKLAEGILDTHRTLTCSPP